MNSRRFLTILAAAALVLGFTPLAQAHPGHQLGGGFSAGAAHPMSGLDHLIVMIGVGLLAARLGGRAMWLLPLGFLASMVAGAALSWAGVQLPMAEIAIVASIVIVGLMLAIGRRMALTVGLALVCACAVFHGYAHGAEQAASAGYLAGFVVSTALLHGSGLALGALVRGARRAITEPRVSVA